MGATALLTDHTAWAQRVAAVARRADQERSPEWWLTEAGVQRTSDLLRAAYPRLDTDLEAVGQRRDGRPGWRRRFDRRPPAEASDLHDAAVSEIAAALSEIASGSPVGSVASDTAAVIASTMRSVIDD